MRGLIYIATGVFAISGVPAVAQQQGQYAGQLQRALEATAEGRCDEQIMGPTLLSACQQQVSTLGPALAALGPIRSVTLTASQQTPQGLVESYRVQFESRQMIWVIGGLHNGKFDIIFSNQ